MKWWQRLRCKINWHSPVPLGILNSRHDRARCEWCGRVGLIDSQGNLF